MKSFEIDQIDAAAQSFIQAYPAVRCIAFYGSMGAGKTTFISALCKALGVKDKVNSPSFTLLNEYRCASGRAVYHFDFYRIKKPEEVFDIGFEEYVDSPGLCLIEWPQIIEEWLPADALRIKIAVLPDGKRQLIPE